ALDGTPAAVEERQTQLEEVYGLVFPPQERKPKNARARRAEPSANGQAPETLSDEEILGLASRAKNGDRFRALMAGDTSGYDDDDSRADSALCCHLACYTKDPTQIDRIFRASKLMRNKWDEVHYASGETYGEHTIAGAIDLVKEQYTSLPSVKLSDKGEGIWRPTPPPPDAPEGSAPPEPGG